MKERVKYAQAKNYANPVYDRPAADPFVLKYRNEYWCYCTGFWKDGRCFGVLYSRDLVNWREMAGALAPIDRESTCYWAPEVTYDNGLFHMYYSVGNEERMQIRVASAARPAGPFLDRGVRLTSEEFAIDPHVFEDDDGSRYLFYATDFLSHERVGTGTVCDRMLDPFTLAGDPRPVTRARHDWQIYDPCRIEKGGVRWHTIEGPFVLKRKGKYYEMFSGGNWKDESYGVSYAISSELPDKDEWVQAADGRQVLPILRSIPGAVIGPGHNSVTRGPDNLQPFCVYHRRSPNCEDRVLAIDRLEWAGERILVAGPTTGLQLFPIPASVTDWFDDPSGDGLGENWDLLSGRWNATDQCASQVDASGLAEARLRTWASSFIAEVSLRVLKNPIEGGAVGIRLSGEGGCSLSFELVPDQKRAIVISRPSMEADLKTTLREFTLSEQFDATADHLLRIELDGRRIRAMLDGSRLRWEGLSAGLLDSLRLFTRDAAGAFAGFALTIGWQDLFTEPEVTPDALGWIAREIGSQWLVEDQHFTCRPTSRNETVVTKGPLLHSYEMVVSAKLDGESATGYLGFFPAFRESDPGPAIRLKRGAESWELECGDSPGVTVFPLAASFDPRSYQQFRFRKGGGVLTIQHEGLTIGEIVAPDCETRVGLCAAAANVSFDSVRVTALKA